MGPGQVSMALATPEFRTPDEEVDVAYPLTEKKKSHQNVMVHGL